MVDSRFASGRDAKADRACSVDRVTAQRSFDHDVAGLRQPDQNAGTIKARRTEGLAIGVVGQVVAANRVRAASPELTHGTCFDVIAHGIDDSQLIVGAHGTTLGGQHRLFAVGGAGVADQTFGHAVHLLQLAPEPSLDSPRQLDWKLRAADLQ